MLFLLFGVFLAFTLLEVTLRAYYFLGEKQLFGLEPTRTTIEWEDDNILGRKLKANQSGWLVSPSSEYFTWIDINSAGWHDSEHLKDKQKEVYRILIIGDSFVENFQVPLEHTFFKQLEKNLNQKTKGKKLEVITMGLGDSGTAQQYLVLKNHGLAYKPDLVLHLLFTGNDIKNNSLALQKDPHRPYFKLVDGKLEKQRLSLAHQCQNTKLWFL